MPLLLLLLLFVAGVWEEREGKSTQSQPKMAL